MKHEMVKVQLSCAHCDHQEVVEVTDHQFTLINNRRGLIQNIAPELTPDQRELIISQTCGKCWEAMFCIPDLNNEEAA